MTKKDIIQVAIGLCVLFGFGFSAVSYFAKAGAVKEEFTGVKKKSYR